MGREMIELRPAQNREKKNTQEETEQETFYGRHEAIELIDERATFATGTASRNDAAVTEAK
jgi:hypothetical protein